MKAGSSTSGNGQRGDGDSTKCTKRLFYNTVQMLSEYVQTFLIKPWLSPCRGAYRHLLRKTIVPCPINASLPMVCFGQQNTGRCTIMFFPVVFFTFLFYFADQPLDVAIWLHFCTDVHFPP